MAVGIYKIINPKGKIYIGQSVDLEKRKLDYKYLNCKKQQKIYNSIKKYSWEQHIFEIVEECSLEQLNEKERYWQDFYNVLKEGLNCRLTKTTDKSGKDSLETCLKRSKSTKGQKRPSVIESARNTGLKNKGRKQSKEEKELRSKIALGIPKGPMTNIHKNNIAKTKYKPIYCVELNKEFISIREASLFLNIKERGISNHLLGYSKSVKHNNTKLTFKYL